MLRLLDTAASPTDRARPYLMWRFSDLRNQRLLGGEFVDDFGGEVEQELDEDEATRRSKEER